MPQDDFKPKLGRIRDATGTRLPSFKQQVLRQGGKAGARARWQTGHIAPRGLSRGMGAGVRAASGLIAPGSRRVIVKARYTRIAGGNLGAARAHLGYIQRDGVTREGAPGQLYDRDHDRRRRQGAGGGRLPRWLADRDCHAGRRLAHANIRRSACGRTSMSARRPGSTKTCNRSSSTEWSPVMNRELQHIPLADLTLSKLNVRRHGAKDIDGLAASIAALGLAPAAAGARHR